MRTPRKILTLAEVSELTTVPVNTLRWLRNAGRGPRLWKASNKLVAYEDDVLAWLDEQYETTSTRSVGA